MKGIAALLSFSWARFQLDLARVRTVATTAAFTVPLFYFGHYMYYPSYLYCVIGTIWISIFVKDLHRFVLVASFASCFLTNRLFQLRSTPDIASVLGTYAANHVWQVTFLKLGALVSTFLLVALLIKKWNTKTLSTWKSLGVLVGIELVAIAVADFSGHTVMAAFLWFFACAFRRTLWAMLFNLNDRGRLRHKSVADQVMGCVPIWCNDYMPIPWQYAGDCSQISPATINQRRQKAVYLMSISGIILFLAQLLSHLLYGTPTSSPLEFLGSLQLPDPRTLPLSQVVSSSPSPASAIATLLGPGTLFLLNSIALMNSYIALAFFFGYEIPLYTQAPWRALNFSDFFRRTFFYYVQLLTLFFFYTIFKVTARLRRYRRIRVSIAIFATIFGGGMLFHYFRDIDYIMRVGFWHSVVGTAQYTPYFFLMALAVSYSVWSGTRQWRQPWQLLRFLRILVVYNLIFLFILTVRAEGIEKKFFALIRILGFYEF